MTLPPVPPINKRKMHGGTSKPSPTPRNFLFKLRVNPGIVSIYGKLNRVL